MKELNVTSRDIYMTLVALYVLKKQFGNQPRHWGFQANRAKEKLKKCGIMDPDELIDIFSIKFEVFDEV